MCFTETSVSASEAHLTGEVKESQHLSPVGTNCASTIVTTSPSLITSTTNRNSHVSQSASTLNSRAPSRTSQDVLNTSFASSGEGHTLLYHTVPAYRNLTSTSGLVGLSMGSPAYKKYLQLKERQHRLKVAQQGGKEDPGGDRLSTLHLMPPTSSMLIDYATDARSMSSLMSYTLGKVAYNSFLKIFSYLCIIKLLYRCVIFSAKLLALPEQHAHEVCTRSFHNRKQQPVHGVLVFY